MPKVTKIEIVPARIKGITGYVSVGRPSRLGNPYKKGELSIPTVQKAVDMYRVHFYSAAGNYLREAAKALLHTETHDGVLRIACPCNGVLSGRPCHAEIIKEYLEKKLAKSTT